VLLDWARQADGLLTLLTDKIDAELLDAAPHLKVVANFAVGFDNFDVPAATQHRVLMTNTPGVLTDTTADLAFTLLMACARRIVEGRDYAKNGHWHTWGPLAGSACASSTTTPSAARSPNRSWAQSP
jgi:glyoxylate reductase